MPVIKLNAHRLSRFIERPITVNEMAKWLPWLGVDIDEVGLDYVKIEFNPNRIDFSSHVGIARALSGLMGWKVGLPVYDVERGVEVLEVDPSVVEVRPFVLGAIVRGLDMDQESIVELMEMQEDIHWGVGRNRRNVSIGIHDLDKASPPFVYTTGDPSVKFVPLEATKEMNLEEILEKHEKGIAFAYILKGATRYPLITDSKGNVLSFPPIINSELTRVTESTRNLFVDVTGTDFTAVSRGLNILVTALHDMGGVIRSIQVNYPTRTITSPDLTPQKGRLRVSYVNQVSGLNISEEEAIRSLERCRLNARRIGRDVLEVSIPAYRIDIMHEIDLVEEVLIGYGFYRIEPTFPSTFVIGKLHERTELADRVRQIISGLGFVEVVNFTLTNEEDHYLKLRLSPKRPIKLKNPVSATYSIVRESLLPGLMKNLAENKHESYPQRLFEVAHVLRADKRSEVVSRKLLHVAGVVSHSSANFTEIKSYVDALLTNLGVGDWMAKETRHKSFITGRVASIYVDQAKIGILGEIHPEVLENFELENPTCAFEIEVERLLRK